MALGIACLHPQGWASWCAQLHHFFCGNAGNPNSGPNACMQALYPLSLQRHSKGSHHPLAQRFPSSQNPPQPGNQSASTSEHWVPAFYRIRLPHSASHNRCVSVQGPTFPLGRWRLARAAASFPKPGLYCTQQLGHFCCARAELRSVAAFALEATQCPGPRAEGDCE